MRYDFQVDGAKRSMFVRGIFVGRRPARVDELKGFVIATRTYDLGDDGRTFDPDIPEESLEEFVSASGAREIDVSQKLSGTLMDAERAAIEASGLLQ